MPKVEKAKPPLTAEQKRRRTLQQKARREAKRIEKLKAERGKTLVGKFLNLINYPLSN
jgi:hypothetical protein